VAPTLDRLAEEDRGDALNQRRDDRRANAGVRRSTKIASVGMKSYVALLRGIAPTNPKMRNDRLRGGFEDLVFCNVRTVISSGNVLFETDSSAVRALETKVEEALPERLGFTSTTIIRSRTEIQALVDRDPFGGVDHSRETNLNVTFLKRRPRPTFTFPHQPQDRDYTILGMYGGDVCSVIDLTSAKTPDLMRWMEKEFGKKVTTRTFDTVERILRRLNEA
jgi:uncharacterized protein (DUF1697 family)